MCESTVYIEKAGKKQEFMKDVVRIIFAEKGVVCTNILGERREIKNARIKEANLIAHNILLEVL